MNGFVFTITPFLVAYLRTEKEPKVQRILVDDVAPFPLLMQDPVGMPTRGGVRFLREAP